MGSRPSGSGTEVQRFLDLSTTASKYDRAISLVANGGQLSAATQSLSSHGVCPDTDKVLQSLTDMRKEARPADAHALRRCLACQAEPRWYQGYYEHQRENI